MVAVAVAALLAGRVLEGLDPSELSLNRLLLKVRPFRYDSPLEATAGALARSLALLVPALAGGAALGLGLALLHRSLTFAPLRSAIWGAALVAAALPAFFWALLAELGLILTYAATGRHLLPLEGYGLDERLILPAVTLGLRPFAVVFRATAIALDEVVRRDHVAVARAKGVPEGLLLTRHVLPNLLPETFAGAAYAARSALSSLAIVEYVYGWGGAGLTFVQAVILADVPLAVTILAAFVALHLALGALASGAVAAAVRRS